MLQALGTLAGLDWGQAAMRKVAGRTPWGTIRRASWNLMTKKPATAVSGTLRSIWRAHPRMSTGNPHKWRNLIATAGLASREPGDCWGKLLVQPIEMRIFAPEDSNQSEAGHLHLITECPETSHPLGQPRRSSNISGGEAAFTGEPGP